MILVTAVLRDSILLVKMCGKHFMQFRNIWLKRHAWESQFFTVTESLHGSVHDGSTIFPQSVAVGSTFNLDLAYQMTKAIATEFKVPRGNSDSFTRIGCCSGFAMGAC